MISLAIAVLIAAALFHGLSLSIVDREDHSALSPTMKAFILRRSRFVAPRRRVPPEEIALESRRRSLGEDYALPILPGFVTDKDQVLSKAPEAPLQPAIPSEAPPVDWWAEARKAVAEIGDRQLKQWRIDRGYDEYVSVMQGDLPILPGADNAPLAGETEMESYVNVYGDIEVAINEHCVMQARQSVFDDSDFMRHVPPLIVCKGASGPRFQLPDFARQEHPPAR